MPEQMVRWAICLGGTATDRQVLDDALAAVEDLVADPRLGVSLVAREVAAGGRRTWRVVGPDGVSQGQGADNGATLHGRARPLGPPDEPEGPSDPAITG